jgi:hypothetical protein
MRDRAVEIEIAMLAVVVVAAAMPTISASMKRIGKER